MCMNVLFESIRKVYNLEKLFKNAFYKACFRAISFIKYVVSIASRDWLVANLTSCEAKKRKLTPI